MSLQADVWRRLQISKFLPTFHVQPTFQTSLNNLVINEWRH
jgi:hypothetical protein